MFRSKLTAGGRNTIATTLLITVLWATPAWAGPSASFDVPEQPLSSALRAVASQAGVQLVFTPETVGAAQGAAVKGEMSVEMALEQLLAGSGLKFRREGERNYVIGDVSRPANDSVLSEMVVTATRTERRVDEVPANVSVIGAKDVAQRNINNVQDLLRTVENIEAGWQFSAAHASSIDIRGVGGSYSAPTTKVLVGGIGAESIVSDVNAGLNFLSPWDVEQVEIVRGPASALYGPEVVGGVVNLIPKRWRGDPGAEIHAAYGSHNTKKTGTAVGAANDIGDFRLSFYNASSDGFVSQTQPEIPGGGISIDIAPRDWKDRKLAFSGGLWLSERQEVSASYQDFSTRSFTQGGHPGQYLNVDGSAWSIGYRHELGEAATIKATYRETRLTRKYGFDNEYLWGIPGDLGLAAKGIKHDESSEFNIQADWRISPDNLLIAGYSRSTGDYTLHGMFGSINKNKSTIDGFYLQNEARFGPWNILIGGRQDNIKMYDDTVNGVATNPSSRVSIFNPRLGAQYLWNSATSLYASAGTAYVPATNAARFIHGDVPNPGLKPEKSVSYEIGMRSKQAFGDFKLALFHTNFKNKINRVEVALGQYQNQNIDRVEVNGVEFGWKGRFGNAWAPFMNYSYTDSRIKADVTNPANVDTRMPHTSVHKLNLGVIYAPGNDWTASLMGTYRSDQYVSQWYCPNNNTDTYECHLGSYFTADLKIAKAFLPFSGKDKWSVWLAVNNLASKKYRQHFPFEYSDDRTLTIGVDGKF